MTMTTLRFLLATLTIAFAAGANFAQQLVRERPAAPGTVRTIRTEKRQLPAVTSPNSEVMVTTTILDYKDRLLEVAEYLPGGNPDTKLALTYDQNGNELERTYYLHDEVSGRSIMRYDGRKRKIEELSLFRDGKVRSKLTYKYDRRGNQIGFELKPNGETVKRFESTLDRRGNELERVEYNDDGTREGRYVYRYDNAGNRVSETHYYTKDGKTSSSRETFAYDRNRQVIESSLYFDGVLESRKTYKRDARGNQIEKVETDSKQRVVAKESWSYEFDPEGTPARIKVSELNAKTPGKPLQRTFEYRLIRGNVKTATFALWRAASEGDAARVSVLLSQSADVNAHHPDGSTPLIKAARHDHREIVQKLLAAGARVDDKDVEGWTALMWSAEFGKLETVGILLKAGANPNARTETGGVAIMPATINGHLDVLKLLLGKGADVNARTTEGATTLMLAASKGNVDVLQFLIDSGADVNARTNDGETALSIAVAEENKDAAELLRKAGAK